MAHREQVLQQALSLPPEDRAFVAAALEESLSAADAEAGAVQLLAELRRRSTAYRAGTTPARTASEVLADQRQSQADEAEP